MVSERPVHLLSPGQPEGVGSAGDQSEGGGERGRGEGVECER